MTFGVANDVAAAAEVMEEWADELGPAGYRRAVAPADCARALAASRKHDHHELNPNHVRCRSTATAGRQATERTCCWWSSCATSSH